MNTEPTTEWVGLDEIPVPSRKPAYPENDSDRAALFTERFGKDLRYVGAWKSWLYWDGMRWVRDQEGVVMRKAQEMVNLFWSEAGRIEDYGERQKAGKLALKAGDARQLKPMIELAAGHSGIAASPDLFDSNAWLLGVKNGVIDLKTGAFRPPLREDYLTKQAGTEYRKEATCPRWRTHLDVVFEREEELIAFYQLSMGYTLTGLTSEQKLFFLHGGGRNGKSTTTEVQSALMGDYGQHAPAALFVAATNGREPEQDIARLKGVRFVVGSEIEEGSKVAESRVKTLTGQDTLVGRFLYGSPFEFQPTHKLFMFGNHKPDVMGTDFGIWRRILLIPFIAKIEDSKVDRQLGSKLVNELPGILNWAIEGCLSWQRSGLQVPETIKTATAEYQDEEDELGEFVEEQCVLGAENRVPRGDLRQAYLLWCGIRGNKCPLSAKKFTKRMRSRAGIGEMKSGIDYWTGVRVKGEHRTEKGGLEIDMAETCAAASAAPLQR